MTHSEEDAVAPIMGHLLMVAVAVILGAVIGGVAFGLAADVTRTVAVAVSAEQAGGDVVLTYMGGRDVPMLDRLDVAVTAEDGTAVEGFFPNPPPVVGDVLTIPAGTAGHDHVVVVARLVDGSRQVVLDVVV